MSSIDEVCTDFTRSGAVDGGHPIDGCDASDYEGLAPAHARELNDSAIPASVAADQGVRTAYTPDELPSWSRWIHDRFGDEALPALVYPMTHPDGSATGQVKPATGSVTSSEGRVLKYVSPAADENPPKLPVLRAVEGSRKALVVEGVKQALAALSWAPDDWSVYRIAGIWSWRVAAADDEGPGAPTAHLSALQGMDVVVVPDADAGTNISVFDGAVALGKACEAYGARSVRYVRVPGAGKDGLDDVLARLVDDEARRALLLSWIEMARETPADIGKREQNAMRKERAKKQELEAQERALQSTDGREPIDVDQDMREVSLALVEALRRTAGGKRVYQRDGELVRVRRSVVDGGAVGPLVVGSLTRSGLRRELLDAVYPYTVTQSGPMPAALTDMLVDLVADHYDKLPRLSGVTRSPMVRSDGSVITEPGYDASTGVYVDLTEDVRDIEVPEHPTDSDIADARDLLRDDLFAMDGAGGYDGWVFDTEADQTHAIAGLITPTVRKIVKRVPALVFDGVHRGVGKGGCVDVIHRIAFGVPASVQPAPNSDEEMEKRLVAKLRAGADTVVLDEVQDGDGTSRLESLALSSFLTSEFYEGRKLGVSQMLNLPNMATVYGLGNNVQVPGDVVRRVYTCRMSSDRVDLETRDNFRHDLDSWVPEHRAELLRAVLVLVRAWYDRGQPAAPKTFGFKSFSEWQRVVGGILHLAGFNGFLSTVLEVRENADSEAADNSEHWEWLASLFPAGTRWGASEVLAQAKADPDAPPPYGRSWRELDARSLSMYYGQHPRWYGGLRIRPDGKLHGKGKAYVIDKLPDGASALVPPAASASRAHSPAGVAPGEVIEISDRNGFKTKVARATPRKTGRTIAELGGSAS